MHSFARLPLFGGLYSIVDIRTSPSSCKKRRRSNLQPSRRYGLKRYRCATYDVEKSVGILSTSRRRKIPLPLEPASGLMMKVFLPLNCRRKSDTSMGNIHVSGKKSYS